MVYKKFVKRGGKRSGPYFYTSARDANGNVKSIYLGSDHKKALEKEAVLRGNKSVSISEKSLHYNGFDSKFLSVFLGILLVLGAIVFIGGITGFLVEEKMTFTADVSDEVISEINQNGSARVIVVLKDAPDFDVKAGDVDIEFKIEKIKEKVRKNQDLVFNELRNQRVLLMEDTKEKSLQVDNLSDEITIENTSIVNSSEGNLTIINESNESFVVANLSEENITITNESEEDLVINDTNDGGVQLTGGVVAGKGKKNKGEAIKIKHRFKLGNGFAANVTKEDLKLIGNNPSVESIYLDVQIHVDLSQSVPLINASKVWPIEVNGVNITGAGQTVCVLDTGVNYSHSALGGSLGNKVIWGYDYVNIDSDPMDDNGHGTHVAGIIASSDSTYRGVAPDAKLIAMKVLDSNGDGYFSDMEVAIEDCTLNSSMYNISVISMSLGDSSFYSSDCDGDYSTLTTAINTAKSLDILVVAASGNQGSTSGINSPACIAAATSVGSTTKSDVISSFTNRAANLDLLAPGQSITSTATSGSSSCAGSGFQSCSGTSMATPHVSGAAALMYQYEKLLNNRNASAAVVESILKREGKQIYDSGTGLNFSRIDVLAAIDSQFEVNLTDYWASNDYAKIDFIGTPDMENISAAFIVTNNSIYLNSTAWPQYNQSADLILYNLPYQKQPIVLKDGALCSSLDCNITSYNGNFTFRVGGFSNYSSGVNSNLTIWDETDSAMPFYQGSAVEYENITFYANYTNRTSGAPVSTGSCNITFSDGTDDMQYDATKQIFVYNKSFTPAGLYSYDITCNDSSFETLATSESITILACGLPDPGTDWIIDGNRFVECNNSILYFQNQTLLMRDNATFVLRNSSLILSDAITAYAINVSSTANFTTFNSIINSTIGQFFDLIIYGYGDLYNQSMDLSRLYIYGNNEHMISNSEMLSDTYFGDNSTNIINDSDFTATVYFQGTSSNTIFDSRSSNTARFRGNSSNIISNSNFSVVWLQFFSGGYDPLVNFTVLSNISSSLTISVVDGTGVAHFYGNVSMPPTVNIIGGTFSRFYPVYVQDLSGNPLVGRQVNVTNSTGVEIWSGTTDSNGLANVNINWTTANQAQNMTLTVNPSQNITIKDNTPIIIQVDQSPSWSGNITSPASPAVYSPGANYLFNITWTDDLGISSAFIEHNFSGTPANCTSLTYSGSATERNYSCAYTDIAVGTYYWKAGVNDTTNQWNFSDTFSFIVSKASSALNLTFDGSEGNITAERNGSVDINATIVNPSNGYIEIYLNSSLINSGSDSLENSTTFNSEGVYNITAVYNTTENYSASSLTYFITVEDTIPPASITNLGEISYNTTWIYWDWTDPADSDFDHVEVWIDGSWVANRTNSYYNATGLSSDTTYQIQTVTVDIYGNRNTTWINDSATTQETPAEASAPSDGGGGAGGAGTISDCIESWECDNWSDCLSGIRTRACLDFSNCGTTFLMPPLQESCGPSSSGAVPEQESPKGIIDKLFGGDDDGTCSPSWILIAIAVLGSLLYCGALYKYKEKVPHEKEKKWLAVLAFSFAVASVMIIVIAYLLCPSSITLWIGFGIIALIVIFTMIYKHERNLSGKVTYARSFKH